jgi:hypothetical protein
MHFNEQEKIENQETLAIKKSQQQLHKQHRPSV